MEYPVRTQENSIRCCKVYTPEDIIDHLREEALEMLMALERVRRGKEPLINLIEEMVDVRVEINTVLTLFAISEKFTPEQVQMLEGEKLTKFESALELGEQFLLTQPVGTLITRYHSIFRDAEEADYGEIHQKH